MARSALLYQSINALVVVLMMPLLLRYLDVNGFVLWSIFITLGGITLQLESAIQMVSVREIANEYHSGNAGTLLSAVRKAKVAYTILSASVLVPFLLLGLLYLNYVASKKLGYHGSIEWILFMSAYALNYYFGANSAILLGMVQVAKFNNINSLTRTINFVTTYLFLRWGYSVLGISLSFALSVVVGCSLIARVARGSLKDYSASPEARKRPNAKFEHSDSSNILKYALYMFSSFVLYKGGLLIAARIFSTDVTGSYGLTLQANVMLSTLALVVPVQVWLHRLVESISSGDKKNVFRSFADGIVFANTVFVLGAIFLFFFGNKLLVLIDSKVMLESPANLFLICSAFIVELNIFLMANFLVITTNYRFVKVYVTTSLIGISVAVLMTWATQSNVATLIMMPLALQTFVCLPLIFRITCNEIGISPILFLRQFGKFILGGVLK